MAGTGSHLIAVEYRESELFFKYEDVPLPKFINLPKIVELLQLVIAFMINHIPKQI